MNVARGWRPLGILCSLGFSPRFALRKLASLVFDHRVHRGERLICTAALWGLVGVLRCRALPGVWPLYPQPLSLRGRGEDFVFFVV